MNSKLHHNIKQKNELQNLSYKIKISETEGGKEFYNPKVAAWTRKASRVRIWDYASPFGIRCDSLKPIYFRMQKQLEFYKKQGIKGIFIENEVTWSSPVVYEFYAMRLWIFAKLLYNPNIDVDKLINDFMTGYYGPGGKYLAEYVGMQKVKLNKYPRSMVDLEFIAKANQLYDKAETTSKHNPKQLARIKDARISLDITTLYFRDKLSAEFIAKGNKIENYPYNTNIIKKRVIEHVKQTKDPFWLSRYPYPNRRSPKIPRSQIFLKSGYIEKLCFGNDYCPQPEQFRKISANKIAAPLAARFNVSGNYASIVKDPQSVCGVALKVKGTDHLPFSYGVYDKEGKRSLMGGQISKSQVKNGNYQVYKLRKTKITQSCYLWLTKTWRIQYSMNEFFDIADIDQEWDVYLSIKFSGQAYPHGGNSKENAIYIDRIFLVRK